MNFSGFLHNDDDEEEKSSGGGNHFSSSAAAMPGGLVKSIFSSPRLSLGLVRFQLFSLY